MSQTKSRNFIFTINNYTDKILEKFVDVAESLERHKYICYGLEEAPETGTKHIQGYIQLSDNQRFTFLHNYFNITKNNKVDKFHVESANGTYQQNKDYTSKSGSFYEFGEPKISGRSDLVELKAKVAENPANISQIIREDCTNNQQLRFVENLPKHYFKNRDIKNPPFVIWLHGKTGSGKSKLVYDSFESICSVSDYKWPGNGYQQQECFLLDDYREQDLNFHELLKIIDRYPFSLANKGGYIPLNSPFIVITTPEDISDTFRFIKEDLEQIRRRITVEINLTNTQVDNIKTYLDENKTEV